MCKHKQNDTPAIGMVAAVAAIALGLGTGPPAMAEDPGAFELDPARLAADTGMPTGLMLAQADAPAEPVAARSEIESTKVSEGSALPISLSLSYALYSDYIWRGINFSEYQGEGREKPNHQMSVDVALDLSVLGLGDVGTIGYNTWLEWYGGQKKIDPERGGQNLREVDYTIYYSNSIEPIATDLTVSLVFIQLPNAAHALRQDGRRGNNNDDRTVDYRILLEHNDAWMWKGLLPDNEAGVLNPSFFLAHDFGAILGVWMEFGLSHGFTVPGIDDLMITPGYKLMAQCDYWKHGFFLAGDQWSLVAEYDLTPVLRLPDWAGIVTITGELYFFNAFGNFEGPDFNGQIRSQDEFWGGMTVNWAWGG